METITKINEIRSRIKEWKRQGLTVALVPTMGALHIGHESLIKKARKEADKVVVSVFVNPIQFGPNEDYSVYPRELEKDQALCLNNGVDIIFAPLPEEMYPEESHLTIVSPPEFYKNKLCGKSRLGHFDGVATVVLKLINIVQPDKAFFGQKDAQQLIILKKVIRDLNIPVDVIGCPIIRNEDGLACSSRNKYLSNESRIKALTLFKTLRKVEELYKSGKKEKGEVFSESLGSLHQDVEVEYMEAYDVDSFEPVDLLGKNTLVAIAARVDGVRLIDNIILC